MSEVAMELTNTRVRKWGKLKVGLSDWGDPAITVPGDPKTNPDAYFDKLTFKPKPFPVGVKELGYITTSGVTDSKSISSNNTQMLQSLTPVRTDLESIEKTIQAAFGESNAYTNALYHGLQVKDWPADKDAAWAYADGQAAEFPWYTLWLQGVDGIGTQAIYRYEIGFRVTVTAIENRVLNRSDPEGFGFTLGLFEDPVLGLSHARAEDGPGYATHLPYTP